MRVAIRSEAEAYRFLFVTVAAFAAIAVASLLGGPWAGVPVWAAVTVAAAIYYLRGRPLRPVRTAPAHAGGKEERHLILLANETLDDRALVDEVERRAAGEHGQVLVVCPVHVSAVRHLASDVDAARALAERRLSASVSRLRAAGVDAHGEIGDEDPVQAIEDALRTFGADEIIISTPPEDRQHRLEQGLADSARARFAVPVTHLVTDGA